MAVWRIHRPKFHLNSYRIKKEYKMAEIIDLDFYRKFRIVLPIRLDKARQQVLCKDPTYEVGHQRKSFRRKRKLEVDPKVTKKD